MAFLGVGLSLFLAFFLWHGICGCAWKTGDISLPGWCSAYFCRKSTSSWQIQLASDKGAMAARTCRTVEYVLQTARKILDYRWRIYRGNVIFVRDVFDICLTGTRMRERASGDG